MSASDDEKTTRAILARLGFKGKNVDNQMKNEELTRHMLDVARMAGIDDATRTDVPEHAKFVVALATAGGKLGDGVRHTQFVAERLRDGKLATAAQTKAAIDYVAKLGGGDLDAAAFDSACGVGVVVSLDDVRAIVREVVAENESEARENGWLFSGRLTGLVRTRSRWAEGKDIATAVNERLTELLGPRPAKIAKKKSNNKNSKKALQAAAEKKQRVKAAGASNASASEAPPVVRLRDTLRFHTPEENTQATPELLEKHLATTGGKVVTRFPPEPNGYLHIGHVKAIAFDFGYAQRENGVTILRYDDTNPEKEKQEYIDGIAENVAWLGFKPWKVTYSSDYFEQLYQFALQLIRDGLAYVCHEPLLVAREHRMNRVESEWRNSSVEENLRKFDDMKNGKYKEGEAVLRMKIDMQNDNPCMRDPVAYRIKYKEHPRTGDQWCIYPSYDYTHCIVDSLENITHSFCTLEFDIRRESYDWLLNALRIFHVRQIEFSRLNVTHSVLSKRKILALIERGVVRGWDDPRLMTMAGQRRRGVTADALLEFVDTAGIGRSNQTLPMSAYELCIRQDLDERCNRAMAVLDPLKVVITNWKQPEPVVQCEAANHPAHPDRGTHSVPFSSVLYIERSDFREVDKKGYKRLAPNKEVRLRYSGIIKCTGVVKNNDGSIDHLEATYDPESTSKPAGTIHWVAEPSPGEEPFTFEAHLYERLFRPTADNPDEYEVAEDTFQCIERAYGDPSVAALPAGGRLQFERVGFFYRSPEVTDKCVFTRIVSLRDNYNA